MKTAIIAIEKDEPNVAEWLEWHSKLADTVFLYLDSCNLPEAIRIPQNAVVLHISTPCNVPTLFAAYNCWLRDFGKDYAWALFIDLDEYFMTHGKTMAELLPLSPYTLSYAYNWVFYGSIEEPLYAGLTLFLLKRFKHRAAACNKHLKPCIASSFLMYQGLNPIFANPHCVFVKCLTGLKTCLLTCTNGLIVAGPYCEGGCPNIETMPYIAHYYSKTAAEFLAKINRGRCDCGKDSLHLYYREVDHMWKEREECDLNDIYDTLD